MYSIPVNGMHVFKVCASAWRPASVCLASISAKIIINTRNRVQTINGDTVHVKYFRRDISATPYPPNALVIRHLLTGMASPQVNEL